MWRKQRTRLRLHKASALVVGISAILSAVALPGETSALTGVFVKAEAETNAIPLIEAVKARNHTAVRALISKQIDIDAAQADGTTALHWASHKGDLEAVRLLLRAGATADISNRYSVTPLSLACGRGHATIVDALLEAGAEPNASLPEGETVLMTAARTGSVDVLRLLVGRGANLDAREHWHGQTALMWAAAENHPTVIHTLVELGANVDERSSGGWSALLFAVRVGHSEAMRALLEAGADVNDTIHAPADNPESSQATDVAPRGQATGTSAWVIAVTNAHYSLAKHLVEQGADPNAAGQGWTALHQLAYTRRPNSDKGMPPVERVDQLDSLELGKFLLLNGADPNQRQTGRFNNGERNNLNRIGATPYLLAAKHADLPFMRLLAARGADPREPTEGNASPLMVAAGVGIFNVGESAGTNAEAFEAVQLAYELGDRDINRTSDKGYTALHGAALRGANPIVQFLVDNGANLLVETREQWTPLRIADGVHYTGTVKRADHTAELLRQLMKTHGVYSTEHERDVNSVAIAKPPESQ